MLSIRRGPLCRCLSAIILMLLLSTPGLVRTPLAEAQTGAPGTLEVRTYQIDTARFPDICVRAAPVTATGALAEVTAENLQIYENGEPRAVGSLQREYIGSQIAIVFDASGSFAQPGSSGANRRFDDAIAALDELVLTKGKWLQQDPKVDQMLLIVPTGPDAFNVPFPWTNQPNTMHNTAYEPGPVSTDTPLYKMLVEAMVRMKDRPDYERRAKFLLVFSDGVDRTSANDVTDVINRANSLGVKILTVKIGPAGAGRTLQRMAEETPADARTEWAFANYTDAASLAPLYSAIKAQAEQYVACYRSKINQAGPQTIEVGVRVGDREYKSAIKTAVVPVKPAAVRITVPTDGAVFDRVASSFDQDPTTIEPRGQPVTVEVAWPDNFPRAIERVLYEVDGSIVADLSADEAFTWDFAPLRQGAHSLRAIVRDELGIEGRSEVVRAQINVVIPTPPPTPLPTATPIPPIPERMLGNLRDQPMLVVVLIVALVAAALALYALIRLARDPRARETVTTTVVGVMRDVTEIFSRPKRDSVSTASRAALIPIIDDAGTRGDPIPIRAQNVAIGRDPAQANIVFADKSVSRLHAYILEEADRVFVLRDEGGANGTYINSQQIIGTKSNPLKTGDVLEFGRVKVIFQLDVQDNPGVAGTPSQGDVTEVLAGKDK